MPVYFNYYENGRREKISMRKAYRQFCTVVTEEQKEEGTTFASWLEEMVHMQIFIRTRKEEGGDKLRLIIK